MSGTLDAITIASIREQDSLVYPDIVQALKTKTSELLEIEILPKSHPLPEGSNVLIEENNIAIPKIRLVQAFLAARQILFDHLANPQDSVTSEDEIRDATAVILLMDGEHLTAANTRKRIIQKHLSRPRAEIEGILREELYFVDIYLTSRLHRQTKSPTLWNHRRWILETSKSIQMKPDIERDIKSVVLAAAERHPRNYYAFSHMRWLLENARPSSPKGHGAIVQLVKKWCIAHPNDTSGFSALLFCLLRIDPFDTRPLSEKSAERSSISREIFKLSGAYQWRNESVWVFLRTIYIAEGVQLKDQGDFFEMMKYVMISCGTADWPKSAMKAASDWCIQNYPWEKASQHVRDEIQRVQNKKV